MKLENFYTVAENETKTDFLIQFTKANFSFTREDGADKSNFYMEQLVLKDLRNPKSYILTIGQSLEDSLKNLEIEEREDLVKGFTEFMGD